MLFCIEKTSPSLDKKVGFLAENATLIGRVTVCAFASVWFQTVLRGDNDLIEIGAYSNVQDGAILHTDQGFPLKIGEFVTVGHKAMLHGCLIGDYSLIGMNATILNGAKIGKYCIIGANALISEGKEIPDYSVVIGIPGKIVRSVSDEDKKMLEKSAETYLEKSKLYLTSFRKVEL
jgi:carbonic anhydrase/acetyltransferase-like protein (isoleucine patch superfamily)